MKKVFGLILILFCSVALFESCAKQVQTTDVSLVLEVKNDSFSDSSECIKHTYEISDSVKRYVDENKAGDIQTVRFMGKEFEIEYESSSENVTRDYILHNYSIKGENSSSEGKKGKSIALSDEGKVVGVFCPSYLQVRFEEKDFADPEQLRATLETMFKEEIDFSTYDQCTVTPSTSVYDSWNDDPNRYYTFFWYHSAGESRLSDSTKMVVSFKDGVRSLWMLNRIDHDYSLFSQKIAYKDYFAVIEAKLNQIYNRDGRLTDYRIWDSVVCIYQGKFYLDCTLFVHFQLTDFQSDTDSCELLVPLQK